MTVIWLTVLLLLGGWLQLASAQTVPPPGGPTPQGRTEPQQSAQWILKYVQTLEKENMACRQNLAQAQQLVEDFCVVVGWTWDGPASTCRKPETKEKK